MKILIIAHHFLPRKDAQTLQMYKVCKLLADAGHEIRVIASVEKHQRQEVDKIQFPWSMKYITSSYAPPSKIWHAMRKLSGELLSLLPFAKAATREALNVIDQWHPDILMTVSTPISSHLSAFQIRERHPDLPWTAFFSDPWPTSILPPPYHRKQVQFHLRSQVKKILQSCDTVILTSHLASRPFETKLKVDLKNKLFLVPHVWGGDFESTPESDEEVQQHLSNPVFDKCLVYAGVIGKERTIPELLSAAKRVSERHPEKFRGLYLFASKAGQAFTRKVRELHAESVIHHAGRVSPNAAFHLTSQATCNLIIEADMSYSPFCPSKYTDCIITERPLLSITPKESEISRLTSVYGTGLAVGYDVDDISKAIETIFVHDKLNGAPNEELIRYLSHENVLQEYESCFLATKQLCQKHKS